MPCGALLCSIKQQQQQQQPRWSIFPHRWFEIVLGGPTGQPRHRHRHRHRPGVGGVLFRARAVHQMAPLLSLPCVLPWTESIGTNQCMHACMLLVVDRQNHRCGRICRAVRGVVGLGRGVSHRTVVANSDVVFECRVVSCRAHRFEGSHWYTCFKGTILGCRALKHTVVRTVLVRHDKESFESIIGNTTGLNHHPSNPQMARERYKIMFAPYTYRTIM
mmetsp:Transcript_3844/g.8280  ORF Transcript_3844/g.8280 Transcript_3844/m.8280 type:complete len:218 (-) Transcript_3844:21-674(-)